MVLNVLIVPCDSAYVRLDVTCLICFESIKCLNSSVLKFIIFSLSEFNTNGISYYALNYFYGVYYLVFHFIPA